MTGTPPASAVTLNRNESPSRITESRGLTTTCVTPAPGPVKARGTLTCGAPLGGTPTLTGTEVDPVNNGTPPADNVR